jgi:hypothetical protein
MLLTWPKHAPRASLVALDRAQENGHTGAHLALLRQILMDGVMTVRLQGINSGMFLGAVFAVWLFVVIVVMFMSQWDLPSLERCLAAAASMGDDGGVTLSSKDRDL